jgi:hypothetical protein
MSSSSPTISSNQSLEDRVAYLESLFLLTTSKSDSSSSLPSSSLLAEVATLKKQLARAEYRIEHLCKALEAVKGTAATEDLLKLK